MQRPLRALIPALAACCVPALAGAAEESPGWTIESNGEVQFDLATNLATATNGITVRYRDAVLLADSGSLNQKTGEVAAEGHVRVTRGSQVWTGDKISYNLQTGRFIGEGFKSGQPPYFAMGEAVVADTKNNVYVAAEGQMTTDDWAKPGYSVRAKSIVIVPGEYIEARGATLHLGSTPVMYLPYFRRNLRDHAPRFSFTPGYRTVHGPFLLTSYNWYWNEKLDGALHVDWRQKRGVGLGPDLNYHLPRLGDGTVRYYYLRDDEPGTDEAGNRIDPDRQRFYFTHQAEPVTNLTVKAAVRWQSDALVIRDFFESEYRDNYQPSTFVEVRQSWPNWSLSAYGQARVNDFFETVERLPEIKLTGLRQQLHTTPFFYESESSFGYLRREFSELNPTNSAYGAVRFDTYHQLLLPETFFGWLNVTPRVGGRFTHYGETDGRGSTLADQDRGVFNAGGEVSFKLSRVWRGAQNRFFQVNGVRHILQPSFNYAYVPQPNRRPDQLPQFDYELPTTRLLPIDFPDYNAIDAIDSQNVLRLGLRNKLQTKRREGIENLVNWALYTDWRIDPRPDQTTFSDVFSDMDLKPFDWLTISSELRYDIDRLDWSQLNHTATITPGDRWSLTLGQRFLRDLPELGAGGGNNLLFGNFYYRLNENWGARMSLHYEAKDGTLEEQQYSLYRDFRAWTTALTFRVRQDRDGPTDYTGALTFSLKSFPRYRLGDDVNKPELLLGE